MRHAKTWKEASNLDRKMEDPRGWIQWKGTDVCMDVHCICGNLGHIDGDFAYRIRCKACGQTYCVTGDVELIAIDEKDDDKDLITTCNDSDVTGSQA